MEDVPKHRCKPMKRTPNYIFEVSDVWTLFANSKPENYGTKFRVMLPIDFCPYCGEKLGGDE